MRGRNPMVYAQRAFTGAMVVLVGALWVRSARGYAAWQDSIVLVSGLVVALYGGLLTSNWRGAAARYLAEINVRGAQRGQRRPWSRTHLRWSGILCIVGGLALAVSAVLSLVTR